MKLLEGVVSTQYLTIRLITQVRSMKLREQSRTLRKRLLTITVIVARRCMDMELSLEEFLDHAEEAFQILSRGTDGIVDLTAQNTCGDTLIHVATGLQSKKMVKHLVLEVGLDINARGDFFMTPYCLACSLGHHDIMDLLLDLGADPSIPDHLGNLPGKKKGQAGH